MEENETVNVTEMQHKASPCRTGLRDCLTDVRAKEKGRAVERRDAMRSADRAAADDPKGLGLGRPSPPRQHLERVTGSNNNIASAGWRAIHPSRNGPWARNGKVRRAEQASAAEPCP